MPHGILNLNKPSGITSRRAVDLAQRFVGKAKIGHAGTLDPLASGVLVVCVGAATRLIQYVGRMPKQYVGTFLLGRTSPTEDVDGDVTELVDPPIPTLEQLVEATRPLTGQIQQRPPAYSALKVAGRRAYELARKGEQVELAPRPVTIHRLEVQQYEYPQLTLGVECGGGTYIRSLGRDLAESLGTGAVMSALTRTAIGGFQIDQAVDPDELTAEDWTDRLLSPLRAVELLPQLELTAEEVQRIRNGQTIQSQGGSSELAAVDSTGRLVAVLRSRGEGLLGALRNMPAEDV